MVIARNWHHTRRHSAPRHALRTVDGQRMRVSHMNHRHSMTNVCGLDGAATQSIQLHPLNIPMGICDQPEVHWPTHVAMVPDIVLALNWFVIVKIIPGRERKGEIMNYY